MKITKIQIVIGRGDIPVLVCPKCDEVLSEMIMGKKCPACDSWTYYHESRKRFYQLLKELLETEEKKPQRCPNVFIERAAQCTREGIQAICGTDEEYS